MFRVIILVMKRHVTPRSLFNDLVRGKIECENNLKKTIATMIAQFACVDIDGKRKWKNLPVISVLNTIIGVCEKLLWDSGHLSEEETERRQVLYSRVVAIKTEVKCLMSEKGG